MTTMPRRQYNDLFGPTVGDRFRLGDTDLWCEVEEDYCAGGDEMVYGGGKTVRDGMGQMPGYTNAQGALDLVITNVILLEPTLGRVAKADIGIKDGKIAGVGKAGNPNVMDGVHPDLVVGAGTDVVAGEHLIATAGATDAHVHFISPQQVWDALSNGLTTLVGGGIGPSDGSNGTTCTPGPWNIQRMLQAWEGFPINVGLLGKGNSSRPESLREQIEAGVAGLKVHEDWGTTPAVIRCALGVADEHDVQVAIHTDTLNEAGYVEDTIDAFDGRTIHTFHSEGAGGGHAPDILRVAGEPNVLPSSTNATRPYTVNTVAELLDMIIVCHHLNPDNPEDVSFADSRVRAETIAAEDVLHDLGALSMYTSDSQAMGRIGETFARAFQTADKMKQMTGKLAEDADRHDNFRVLRYLAKLTINPAITHGFSHVLGSLAPGMLADIVLWPIEFFGSKPKMVLKGGMIAWSVMGEPNASLSTPEPVFYRPMFAAYGGALARSAVTLMSQAAVARGMPERYGLQRPVVAVRGTRQLKKTDLVRNGALPAIRIDPETFQVFVDGRHATVAPAKTLPLAQGHYIV